MKYDHGTPITYIVPVAMSYRHASHIHKIVDLVWRLQINRIHTVGDVLKSTQYNILRMRGIGHCRLNILKEALCAMNPEFIIALDDDRRWYKRKDKK